LFQMTLFGNKMMLINLKYLTFVPDDIVPEHNDRFYIMILSRNKMMLINLKYLTFVPLKYMILFRNKMIDSIFWYCSRPKRCWTTLFISHCSGIKWSIPTGTK
jgi:hypothetical protein